MMALPFLAMAAAACTPVRGPLLQARDLFPTAPAGVTIGFTPAPGSRRVLPQAEIDRLAKRFEIASPPREACFEYATQQLDRTMVLAAIEQMLPGVEAEIFETNSSAVPEGRVVFPLSALPKPPQSEPDSPVLWRGYIEYAERRRFTIWAKVRLAVSGTRLLATGDIPAGRELTAGDVEKKVVRSFPTAEQWVEQEQDVIGRRTLRRLRAGEAIPVGAIHSGIYAVMSGDAVNVAVDSGAAHLSVTARAESSAAVGDLVKLRNAQSGKVFEARVLGKGAAIVSTSVTGEAKQ